MAVKVGNRVFRTNTDKSRIIYQGIVISSTKSGVIIKQDEGGELFLKTGSFKVASGGSKKVLKGEKGDRGEQGKKGSIGDRGEQGSQGERGLKGEKGDKPKLPEEKASKIIFRGGGGGGGLSKNTADGRYVNIPGDTMTGNLQMSDGNQVRFLNTGNYVGFVAPTLSADQIWELPTADGKDGDVLTTDGAGKLSWMSEASEKAWAFRSRSGASGTTYTGGFYEPSGAADDFSGGPTFGTANASRAAHFFIVTGGVPLDVLTIRVTGTSITDAGGSRNPGDTEDIVVPEEPTVAGKYFETAKKWLGQVTITVVSGTARICDFGFCKYWDNNNTDFTVSGLEATWLGGATDTAPNLILRHHKGTNNNTDWNYTGSGATPPTAIATMVGDHSATEDNVINGENGAWKRTDLSENIAGSGSEGTLLEIVTTSNKAFELGNFLLRITPQ